MFDVLGYFIFSIVVLCLFTFGRETLVSFGCQLVLVLVSSFSILVDCLCRGSLNSFGYQPVLDWQTKRRDQKMKGSNRLDLIQRT